MNKNPFASSETVTVLSYFDLTLNFSPNFETMSRKSFKTCRVPVGSLSDAHSNTKTYEAKLRVFQALGSAEEPVGIKETMDQTMEVLKESVKKELIKYETAIAKKARETSSRKAKSSAPETPSTTEDEDTDTSSGDEIELDADQK